MVVLIIVILAKNDIGTYKSSLVNSHTNEWKKPALS